MNEYFVEWYTGFDSDPNHQTVVAGNSAVEVLAALKEKHKEFGFRLLNIHKL